MSKDPKNPADLADEKDAAMEKGASKKDPSKVAEESPGSTTEVSPSDAMAKQPGFEKFKDQSTTRIGPSLRNGGLSSFPAARFRSKVQTWILGCAQRYATFFLFVVGLGRAASWILGLDDEIKAQASASRPLIAVMLVLSFIAFAMYDALRERDR